VTLPAVFVSHGAPTLAIERSEAHAFLRTWGGDLERRFGRPRAILAVSAHWETAEPMVSTAREPETIHDFRGFADELHRMTYPAPGAPELAARVVERLDAGGVVCRTDERRGLDHGAWVPLALLFPEATIPVTQLSIQPRLGPEHHWRLGEALAPLRDDGVLILATGQVTHNLGELGRYAETPPHIAEFVEWLAARAAANDREALVDYRARAPHAARNHPTDEHLLPIHVALGASAGRGLRRVHRSTTYGYLRMDAFETAEGASS
jgi:4,5-DOPA dioxygenase extradiol